MGNQAYAFSYLFILYIYSAYSEQIVAASLIVGIFISLLLIARKALGPNFPKMGLYASLVLYAIFAFLLKDHAHFFLILCSQMIVGTVDNELKHRLGSDNLQGVGLRVLVIVAPLIMSFILSFDDFLLIRIALPLILIFASTFIFSPKSTEKNTSSLYEDMSSLRFLRLTGYGTLANYIVPLMTLFIGAEKDMESISVIMHITTSGSFRIIDYALFAKRNTSRYLMTILFCVIILLGLMGAIIQSYLLLGFSMPAFMMILMWSFSIALFVKELGGQKSRLA